MGGITMKQQYDSYKPSGIDWIGDIPSHWKLPRVKQFVKINNGSDPKMEGDIPVYGSGSGSFKTCGEFKTGPTVLLGRKGATLHIPHWIDGKYWNVDTAFDTKIIGKLNLRLFFYHSMLFNYEKYKSETTLPSMTQTDYGNMYIPIPPLAEQEAIAAWLDEKCGEIDAAIAKVDREIELIDELKQSEISRVVTRGLNSDAPLRPSGIDWIGDIPEHWIIAPFKRSLKINNGCDYKHIVSEEGYPVIGSGGQFAFASDYLYDGEVLLLGRKGTIDRPMHYIGKFWTVDTMFYAIPNNNVCCKYMYYQALGFPFDYYSTATALPSMAASDLANNPIIVPPLPEQQAIADYLDKKCADIDGLKAKLSKKRETLTELRQSIISEAVTGKRRVAACRDRINHDRDICETDCNGRDRSRPYNDNNGRDSS